MLQEQISDGELYYNLGDEYFRKGEIENALRQYTLAIAADKQVANYYAALAETLYIFKRYEEVCTNLAEAIKLEPSEAVYYDGLARTYQKLNNSEQVNKNMQIAQKLRLQSSSSATQMGNVVLTNFKPLAPRRENLVLSNHTVVPGHEDLAVPKPLLAQQAHKKKKKHKRK